MTIEKLNQMILELEEFQAELKGLKDYEISLNVVEIQNDIESLIKKLKNKV